MERRVADGARILSDLEAKTEGHRRILDQSTAQVREMNNLKKQIEDELAQRKKDIQAAKRELLEMENAVKGILMSKDEMQKKTAVLAQREHQLAEQESRIDQKKKELESKRLNLENAERTKQEVSALMEEKKHVLGELKTAVGQNGQLLKEIHEREQKARKAEHDALIAQRESDKKLKMLDSKEKDVTRKEATWTDHEKALKEAIQLLAKDKKDFVDEVNARKAEFLLLSQEWEKKFKDLQEEKRALQVEKTDVRKLVETDVLGLKEKEDELVETIAMLERDKDKLEFEERALLKRVGELERAKAALEKEQKSLGAREKRIIDGERIVQKGMKYIEAEKRKVEHEKDAAYRARELRKVLPKMEHRYEELRRAIAKLEARAMETGARPAMSRVLREREKELEMKEKGIHVEVGRLMEREREVEELEARKEKAFSTYLREEVERVQQGKPGREIVNPEIHAMIDDAREKVMQGRLDDAVRLVAEAEYLAEKVQNSEQRRMLMYDIRDLKASIKLASLT
jgi:chromosome segregation ATPase